MLRVVSCGSRRPPLVCAWTVGRGRPGLARCMGAVRVASRALEMRDELLDMSAAGGRDGERGAKYPTFKKSLMKRYRECFVFPVPNKHFAVRCQRRRVHAAAGPGGSAWPAYIIRLTLAAFRTMLPPPQVEEVSLLPSRVLIAM